jgi:outer membrane protein assembly factor BamA
MMATVTADRQRKTARVRFDFRSGPRATFGPVTIRGLDAFPDLRSAVGNRIAWEPNGPYSATAIVKTQQALYDLGRFATVNVEPDKVDENAVIIPVKITVTLSVRHDIKAGGGGGIDPANYEARVRGTALLIPEWFPLWTLSADARVAIQQPREPDPEKTYFENLRFRTRALLSATRVDLFRPFLRGDVGTGYEFNVIEAYTALGPIARLGVSYPLLTRRVQLRLGWAFSFFSFADISEALSAEARTELGFDRNNGRERNGSFQQALVADFRDDRLAPRKGVYFDVRVSEGTALAGSALTYLQINPDFRWYVPVTKKIVLAGRVRGGTILGEVPITERYFAGGSQSHRGFSERQLSPTRANVNKDGTPVEVIVGGSTVVETGAELRVPLFSIGAADFGSTLFVDYGDCTESLSAIDPFNMHLAAGVGLSLRVVGIKFRLDVAQRLNRYGPGEPEDGRVGNEPPVDRGTFAHTLVHIGVGETF